MAGVALTAVNNGRIAPSTERPYPDSQMKTTMLMVLALSTVAACAVDESLVLPTVELRGDADARTLAAAEAWDELGFNATLTDFGQPDCPADWHAQEPKVVDCAIRIEVRHDKNLAVETGVFGLASPSRRIVWIELTTAWAGGVAYDWLAAHEVGHVVLVTDEHLVDGEHGVMKPEDKTDNPDSAAVISADDRALACETIGACL